MNAELTIGRVAELTGVPAKTIRYYEDAGLLRAARRGKNGYRRYDERSVAELAFVSRARGLGFSVKDVAALLALWRNRRRASSEVRAIAQGHLAAIDRKLAELAAMRATLTDLINRCHGNDRPDCPIIDRLAPATDEHTHRGGSHP